VRERYPEHILLDSQWDAVYDAIKAMGFNPSEFGRATTYGRNYNGMVPNLIHVSSGSEFVFDFDPKEERHADDGSDPISLSHVSVGASTLDPAVPLARLL